MDMQITVKRKLYSPQEIKERLPMTEKMTKIKEICKEVLHSCKLSPEIRSFVKGFMIESYLEDGSQKVDGGCYGKSITDPCLGWEKTERLIFDIAELL